MGCVREVKWRMSRGGSGVKDKKKAR